MAKILTAKTVEGIAPGPRRQEVADGALPGFYLVVQPSGAKSWALRYRFEGKPRKLTVGSVLLERKGDGPLTALPLGHPMTLTEARRAAREALQTLAEGRDPSTVKKVLKAARTVEADDGKDTIEKLGERFIERYAKPRNRSWRETQRQFKVEINPSWGKKKATDIRKRDVLDLLDGIVDRGSPVTANRVFATLRKFFGWLIERDVVQSSPCSDLRKPTPEESRERVLTDEEMKLFWEAASGFEYPFGPMWRLLLLTGQRRQEVAGMRWSELTLTGDAQWLIPGARTKNGKEHLLPLPPDVADLVEALPRIGKKGFVFTTTGDTSVSGFSRSKDRLDAAMLAILKKRAEESGQDVDEVTLTPWTLHDLRRTMASGMAALNINLPIIEKVLNHSSGSFSGIVSVYQRHDFKAEKLAAMKAWADWVMTLVGDKTADNVTVLRRA